MPTPTYHLISTYTVSTTSESTIDFTVIPQTYTDLQLLCSLRNDDAAQAQNILLTFNDNTTGYTNTFLQGNSTSIGQGAVARMIGDIDTAYEASGVFNAIKVDILNYSSASLTKLFPAESAFESQADSPAWHMLTANIWNNASAITKLSLSNTSAGKKFVQYSKVSLYGIKSS